MNIFRAIFEHFMVKQNETTLHKSYIEADSALNSAVTEIAGISEKFIAQKKFSDKGINIGISNSRDGCTFTGCVREDHFLNADIVNIPNLSNKQKIEFAERLSELTGMKIKSTDYKIYLSSEYSASIGYEGNSVADDIREIKGNALAKQEFAEIANKFHTNKDAILGVLEKISAAVEAAATKKVTEDDMAAIAAKNGERGVAVAQKSEGTSPSL